MIDAEDAERQLRMDQMTVTIEKMRFDIAETQRQAAKRQQRAERNQKWETRKFQASAILATTAAVGAGVGIGNLIWAHRDAPPPPSPPQIIFQPGSIAVSPAPGPGPKG